MSVLHLLPVGEIAGPLLEELRRGLAAEFRARCEILPQPLEAEFAFSGQRHQYHSTEILRRMQKAVPQECWRLLGVTAHDLYMPILTFVFGEAQLNDTCAVVSAHRLRQEFYGLPANPELLRDRLLKEAVHELGHTFGLTHCRDYACVMAASHAVERIDLKGSYFCPACRPRVAAFLPAKKFLGIF
jgi:archaemetzincin